MRLVPAPGKVIAEKIEPKKQTDGGIILPDAAADADCPDKLERGRVIASSNAAWADCRVEKSSITVEVGTVIIYQAHAGYWWTDDDGRKYRIIDFADIVATEKAEGAE